MSITASPHQDQDDRSDLSIGSLNIHGRSQVPPVVRKTTGCRFIQIDTGVTCVSPANSLEGYCIQLNLAQIQQEKLNQECAATLLSGSQFHHLRVVFSVHGFDHLEYVTEYSLDFRQTCQFVVVFRNELVM